MTRRQVIGFLAPTTLGLFLVAMPLPSGLTRPGQLVLAVAVFTIGLWISGALQNDVASILMVALFVLVGVKPNVAFAGFSNTTVWLLAGAMCYGAAMSKTGLIIRLAYFVLRRVPPTYPSVLFAFTITGFVVSMAIPSITVRVVMVMPLVWGIIRAIDLPDFSQESAFLGIGGYLMMVLPGTTYLTGSLWGAIVIGLLPEAVRAQVTWLSWFQVFGLPAILLTLGMILATLVVLRPRRAFPGRAEIQALTGKLGPMKRDEKITAVVMVVSVILWVLSAFVLPSYLTYVVPMLGMAALFYTGVLERREIMTAPNWPTLLFYVGMFSLVATLTDAQVMGWLAQLVAPMLEPVRHSLILFVIVIALVVYALRMLDVTNSLTLLIVFAPLAALVSGWGIPLLVFAAVIVFSCHTFFFTYQAFWIILAREATQARAWTERQQLKMAIAFAAVNLVLLVVDVFYWRIAGVV